MSSVAGDPLTPGHSAVAPRPGVWLTDLSLLLMALIWGVNFTVVKFATGLLDPLAFNAVRVTGAAVSLLLIGMATRGKWPSRRVSLVLVALGVLGNGAYQVCFVEGVAHTRAGDAALLAAVTPAFIALLGRFRGTDQIGAKGWSGIWLSIAGIGCVAYGTASGDVGNASILGDTLILIGAGCWAVYTVLLKPYTHQVDGVKLSGLTMVGGAVPLLLIASPRIATAHWSALPSSAYVAMTYSGLCALVIAYLFWYRGIRVIGPTRTAMYSNLQPLFAVTVAWLALGETPTIWQGIGGAAIMSGLLLTR